MNVGMGAVAHDARFAKIQAALAETVMKEALAFADPRVYPAPAKA